MTTIGRIISVLLLGYATSALSLEIVHHPRQNQPMDIERPRLAIKDADSHGGMAQAAVPGRIRPGEILSFYSYARPAGRYRIVWRLKVDDNSIADVVFSARTAEGKLQLKGTDFVAANQYQEFSYIATKGEGGFFTMTASWTGKNKLLIDHVMVKGEHLFSDRELVDKQGGIRLPNQWLLPKPTPPRLHFAKGLWWDFFGLRELPAALSGATVTSSYYGQAQGGASQRYFPASWREMAQHNVVVLANISVAGMNASQRYLLREYVSNGGGLLLLGGRFSFQNMHSSLGELAPFQLGDERIVKAANGLELSPQPAAQGILPDDLTWQMKPRLYYHHPIEPKADTQVLLKAGDHPLLVVGQVGKGRVAAFVGSVEGNPPADELAFWEWGDFPQVLASVCQWLMAAPQEKKAPSVVDDATRNILEKLAITAPDDKEEERHQMSKELLSRCQDKAFAHELIAAISSFSGNPNRRFVSGLAAAIAPFVDESFGEPATELIDSGVSGKVALGLRIWGLIGTGQTRAMLSRYLRDGAAPRAQGAMSLDDNDAGDAQEDHLADERCRLAAAIALGDLGDSQAVRDLKAITQEFSNLRQPLTAVTERPALNEEIYQQSLASRCRLGDVDAAPLLAEALRRDIGQIETLQNALDVMLINKKDKVLMNNRKVAGIRLPSLHYRQAFCRDRVGRFPYDVAARFAAAIVVHHDPKLTAFGFAALAPREGRRPDGKSVQSIIPLIQKAANPEMRMLAYSLAAAVESEGVARQLADVLVGLARSQRRQDVRFALRRVPQLPTSTRTRILEAAQAHPHPEIKRLVTLSQQLLR